MPAPDRLAERLPRRTWIAGLCVILLLATILRLIGLDKPLYIDEIVTITVATQPPDHMGEVMRQIDASPALYPLLLHVWTAVSRSDGWVRLLSVIFGIAAVWICAVLVRRLFGDRAGLAAALVMALAPAHIHYAQYVRSYSLFTLLAGVHLLVLMDLWQGSREKRRSRLVAAAVLTAALLYTHYLSLLLFGAEGVWLLLRRDRWRDVLVPWVLALAAGAVLFLPGLPLLLHNIEHDRVRNSERPVARPAWEVLPNLVGELSVGQRILGFDTPAARRATLTAAAVVFPALVLAGIAAGIRTGRRDVVLFSIAVTVLPIVVYVGSGRRLIAVRFFVPFMFGYLALIGAGLASLRRRYAVAATLAIAVICAIPLEHYYRDFRWSYDHRAVARALAARSAPGDGVLVVHPFEAFFYRWYLGGQVRITGLVFTALEDQDGYVIKPPPVRLDTAIPRIRDAFEDRPRLWLVGGSPRSFATDPGEESRIFSWMESEFVPVTSLDDVTGGDPRIALFERPAAKGSR